MLARLGPSHRVSVFCLQADLPLHLITLDGRSCPIHKNTEQYEEIERMSGMVAWNGDPECMIDRFDVRAMLDFYREYEPPRDDVKTEEERELEEVCFPFSAQMGSKHLQKLHLPCTRCT